MRILTSGPHIRVLEKRETLVLGHKCIPASLDRSTDEGHPEALVISVYLKEGEDEETIKERSGEVSDLVGPKKLVTMK